MKETAVQWLVDELILEGFYVPKGLYDKAKQMEKEQIIEAYESLEHRHGKNYYNETFKSE